MLERTRDAVRKTVWARRTARADVVGIDDGVILLVFCTSQHDHAPLMMSTDVEKMISVPHFDVIKGFFVTGETAKCSLQRRIWSSMSDPSMKHNREKDVAQAKVSFSPNHLPSFPQPGRLTCSSAGIRFFDDVSIPAVAPSGKNATHTVELFFFCHSSSHTSSFPCHFQCMTRE